MVGAIADEDFVPLIAVPVDREVLGGENALADMAQALLAIWPTGLPGRAGPISPWPMLAITEDQVPGGADDALASANALACVVGSGSMDLGHGVLAKVWPSWPGLRVLVRVWPNWPRPLAGRGIVGPSVAFDTEMPRRCPLP